MIEPQVKRIQSTAFLISITLAVLLGCSYTFGFFYHTDTSGSADIVLDSRINPNQASVASLLRLPGIGRSLAEAIVSHREALESTDNYGVVFQKYEDLQNVSGIGPKKSEDIAEWLKFE